MRVREGLDGSPSLLQSEITGSTALRFLLRALPAERFTFLIDSHALHTLTLSATLAVQLISSLLAN
jgi:hypothetical protein